MPETVRRTVSLEGRPLEEENDLVKRATRGDVSADEALVRGYQELAFRTAYLILGDPDEAADAAQDAFVKAYGALGRFRAGAPFRPWLLQIVASEARNRRRAAGRRASLALRVAEDRPSDDAAPSPESSVLATEERASLLNALDRLRPEDRLVIAYRYFFDLSEAEMASLLGCARGTVKSRLSRALDGLRQVLDVAVGDRRASPRRRGGIGRG